MLVRIWVFVKNCVRRGVEGLRRDVGVDDVDIEEEMLSVYPSSSGEGRFPDRV